MNWFCRRFGHLYKQTPVIQGINDYVADRHECRICGYAYETVRPGWEYSDWPSRDMVS